MKTLYLLFYVLIGLFIGAIAGRKRTATARGAEGVNIRWISLSIHLIAGATSALFGGMIFDLFFRPMPYGFAGSLLSAVAVAMIVLFLMRRLKGI